MSEKKTYYVTWYKERTYRELSFRSTPLLIHFEKILLVNRLEGKAAAQHLHVTWL